MFPYNPDEVLEVLVQINAHRVVQPHPGLLAVGTALLGVSPSSNVDRVVSNRFPELLTIDALQYLNQLLPLLLTFLSSLLLNYCLKLVEYVISRARVRTVIE